MGKKGNCATFKKCVNYPQFLIITLALLFASCHINQPRMSPPNTYYCWLYQTRTMVQEHECNHFPITHKLLVISHIL